MTSLDDNFFPGQASLVGHLYAIAGQGEAFVGHLFNIPVHLFLTPFVYNPQRYQSALSIWKQNLTIYTTKEINATFLPADIIIDILKVYIELCIKTFDTFVQTRTKNPFEVNAGNLIN